MNNVVPLPRPEKVYHGIHDAEAAMTVLRTALDKYDDNFLVGRKIGVSASCIRAIRKGYTKWPRHGTFFALLTVLGLEMVIRPRQG